MINTIGALWLMIGLVIVVVMVVLSLIKKTRWKTTGKTALTYVVGLIILVVISMAMPEKHTAKKQTNTSNKPAFTLQHKSSDVDNGDITFTTNDQGDYTVTLLGKRNGKITIKNDNPEGNDQKVNVKKQIKKGQTIKVPIHVNDNTPQLDLIVKDNHGHKKSFSIDNNSSAYNSSSAAASESRAREESAESASKPANAFTSALQKSVDNWNGGDNSINVKKAWYKDHTTFIAVDIDDWKSLSPSAQQDFADNWLQSVQGLYRMSDKKGSTNVMIVDNGNHDHMLAHTRSLHDTMKIDD